MKLPIPIAAVTGRAPELTPVPGNRLAGLPVFLAQAYRFLRFEWLGQTLILAQTDPGDAPPPIGRLRTQRRNLADHFGCPVVFVFPMLDTYHLNRFASEGIPSPRHLPPSQRPPRLRTDYLAGDQRGGGGMKKLQKKLLTAVGLMICFSEQTRQASVLRGMLKLGGFLLSAQGGVA